MERARDFWGPVVSGGLVHEDHRASERSSGTIIPFGNDELSRVISDHDVIVLRYMDASSP